MLLVIDVGNTHAACGVYRGKRLIDGSVGMDADVFGRCLLPLTPRLTVP